MNSLIIFGLPGRLITMKIFLPIIVPVYEVRDFEIEIQSLISKKKLMQEDYLALKTHLAEYPESGDLVPGSGGLRKIRLQSISSGKRGGFRVCYYYKANQAIYLIWIYKKNEQENISHDDKEFFKQVIKTIKGK